MKVLVQVQLHQYAVPQQLTLTELNGIIITIVISNLALRQLLQVLVFLLSPFLQQIQMKLDSTLSVSIISLLLIRPFLKLPI